MKPFHADKSCRIFHADNRLLLPQMKSETFDSVVTADGMSSGGNGKRDTSMFNVGGVSKPEHFRSDSGSVARFFYCAKASADERNRGLKYVGLKNTHTTVKPLDLMRYLVRLVTRPDGLILDPFLGSGTTRLACQAEGMRCVGIEQDEMSCRISVSTGIA